MQSYSTEAEEAQARAAFHMRLRARGVQDIDILRALEVVARDQFIPHRYIDLARRDMALPIACGGIIPEAWLVARMAEALAPTRAQRVLEIGTGSGYATAVFAQLAREVVSIERSHSLAIEAQTRLKRLGIANAAVVWGDGLAVPREAGQYECVVVQGYLDEVPAALLAALAPDGVLVMAQRRKEGQRLVRTVRMEAGALVETDICACRLPAMLPGTARAL